MANATRPAPSIDPKLIVSFVTSVREVFKTMAGVDTTTGKPFYKTTSKSTHGVCGIIGFHGALTGSVVVSFADQAAEKLVEAFVGTPLKVNEPDFADAVGELANMIAGSAKGRLETVASISTPSVILGGYTIATTSTIPCVVIPCQCVHGEFTVEVSVKVATPAVAA